jgi:hypothetical protein
MSDQYTLLCDTYTKGSVEIFLVIKSTKPTLALPKDRFSIPFNGIATFVRSPCLKNIQQSERGSLIAYRHKVPSINLQEWQIGIVHPIWYNQPNQSNHIEVWAFLDGVDSDGIPTVLKCCQWDSMKPLLRFEMYYLNELELIFLNQVRTTHTLVCAFYMTLLIYQKSFSDQRSSSIRGNNLSNH